MFCKKNRNEWDPALSASMLLKLYVSEVEQLKKLCSILSTDRHNIIVQVL